MCASTSFVTSDRPIVIPPPGDVGDPKLAALDTYNPCTRSMHLTMAQLKQLYDEPQELGVFKNPYHQYVADHHSAELAGRMEACGTEIRKEKCAKGHVTVHAFYCNKKSCLVCAELIAQAQFKRYSLLDKDHFHGVTYIEVSQAAGAKARKALHRMKRVKILSKDGWRNNRLTCGILLLAPAAAIPEKIFRELQALDPELEIVSHERTEFLALLKKVLNPALPPSFADRLAMEIGKKRQISFLGATQAERKKLAVKENSHTDNLQDSEQTKKAPICQKCGSPIVCRTRRMLIGTLLADEHWYDLDPSPPPPGEF